jgi:hypothetical protein
MLSYVLLIVLRSSFVAPLLVVTQSVHRRLDPVFSSRRFQKEGRSKGNIVAYGSYDEQALTPSKDLIDGETGMREFFLSNTEWLPLFRSLSGQSFVPATSIMEIATTSNTEFEFHEDSKPWRRLDAIPAKEDEKAVLAGFLDAIQQSFIDIPVDETTKEDANDLHFIEEGRRMLVCSRFHVVQGMEVSHTKSFDNLFSICWSEITELRQTGDIDTGSLIVVPGCKYNELRRFTDMNLQRPLQWLGIHDNFDVESLEHGGLGAVRLIHKLSDIPTDKTEQSVE